MHSTMYSIKIAYLSVLFSFHHLVLGVDNRTFPSTFKFGVATAAYQVEGGWNEDGKGESIWDFLTHSQPDQIADGSNGDVACDSYHHTDADIDLLKNLNVDFYRLSISWPRILPTGTIDHGVNQAGVDYYNDLLTKLQKNGIKAMVTLYHWDLPQQLQEKLGGWPSAILADIYADYARLAFELFGDRVKYWVTFNEPHLVCQQGYESGGKAPAIKSPGEQLYLCGHVLLKAHAKAYRIYDQEFRHKQNGKISIVINSDWFEADGADPKNEEAAERNRQFYFGWFANPIVHGDYPQIMIDRIGNRSKLEGYASSRLPQFTSEEIEFIKGTYDYIGLNHYTTALIKWKDDDPIGEPSSGKDLSVSSRKDENWEGSASSWLKVVPWGIRKITKWIKDTYDNPEIIITENGTSDLGEVDDQKRIKYYREYLSCLLEAIYDDGVNVTGYAAWSFLDNFEWNRGYIEKFGFYLVDFADPNRTRTPKASVDFYKNVIATRILT